jgi:hypothetical protein
MSDQESAGSLAQTVQHSPRAERRDPDAMDPHDSHTDPPASIPRRIAPSEVPEGDDMNPIHRHVM